MKVTYRENCRLCGRKDIQRVVELDPIALPNRYELTREAAERAPLAPINVYLCQSCGHVQQLEVVDEETVWEAYNYQSSQASVMTRHFEDFAAKLIAKYRPPQGALIIDIGSNDGALLRPFKEAGYRVLGVELVKEIAEQASANGIETFGEPLSVELAEKIRRKYGGAAVVTAFNVFAHSDNLRGMAKAIQALLAADGLFVFEAQYLADVVDKTLVATIFHEHLSHHAIKPLQSFLGEFYMQIIDVDRVPIQHGSIIGYVQFVNGKHQRNPYVDELIALENQMGLGTEQTLRRFAGNIRLLRVTCEALAKEWRSRGATVAAYGAARSGPGLISMLGLKGVIDFIVDDHPQKVGRFSPGDGIPIVETNQLLEKQPDYCVILAWVHADRIIEANSEYLKRGGRFVVLCPNFRVVSGERLLEAA